VGYHLTLADVYLITIMIDPFKLFIDKKTRDKEFPNLTRYITVNLQNIVF